MSGSETMKSLSRTWLTAASALPILMMLAGTAHAQAASEGARLEEIVVTADKTGVEKLQSTPQAVSVIGGEALQRQGVANIRDLAQLVPNMTFAQNTSSALLYIRGIGSNNTAAGSDPDVTVQIDGVYIARPSGQTSDFLDVARIEVLRGPQGTLYGRNAVGGTLNIISRAPSTMFNGAAQVTAGNYGLVQGDLYVTGPLGSDKLLGSLAIDYKTHDPYFKNIAPGGRDVGDADHAGARAQLKWLASDAIDATTRIDVSAVMHEHFENYSHMVAPAPFPALANTLVGDFRTVALNSPQVLVQQIGGISEEMNWRLGGPWTLKSITAWRTLKSKASNDNDATDQFVQFAHLANQEQQGSQEFNLQYAGERLKGVLGVYYFQDLDRQRNDVAIPPSVTTPAARALFNAARPDIGSKSGAVFAQGVYEVIPGVSLTVGGRYTSESKEMSQYFVRTSLNPATVGAPFPGFPLSFQLKREYHAFTPKVALDWKITDDAMVYVSATRGYKSGGFNFSATTPATATFAPEKIWSYEAGAKTQWLDDRLRVNATAFRYDYSNLQVSQLIAAATFSIGNAASATVNGFELEVTGKPTSELQLTGNFSALDATYDKYPGASVPAGLLRFEPRAVCVGTACTIDAAGKSLNAAPRYSGVLAVDDTHRFGDLSVAGHVDYSWRSRTFFDPSNNALMSQGAYGLLNAFVSISPSDNWTFQVWGRNLTNEGYYVTVSASGVTVNGLVGDPRTFGVRLLRSW
jgi:iron complex outermembrane receptor protein